MLIDNGAPVDSKNKEGKTVLHLASLAGWFHNKDLPNIQKE